MAVDSATPLAEKLLISKGEAVLAVYVVGTFLLVLVAFTAGLFVRSFNIKKDAASFLEDKVLNKLPPYVALRKYTDRLAGLEGKTNEDLKPVLVRMQNGWQLGFLADAFNDGQVAVFMPGAPNPSSGVVQIVSYRPHHPSRYFLSRRTRVPRAVWARASKALGKLLF